jgi:hypothetical protein
MIVLVKFAIGINLDVGSFTSAESITESLMVLPKETVMYSGHGERTTIGYNEEENNLSSGDSVGAAKRR